MSKWYKSAPIKGILIVIEHILVVAIIISAVWIASFPGVRDIKPTEMSKKEFQDTSAFNSNVQKASQQILANIGYSNIFETDGKFDENRIVDVQDYAEKHTITGENVNGIAYRLGDLYQWSKAYEIGKAAFDYYSSNIMVAQGIDGDYRYFPVSEIETAVKNGDLTLKNPDYDESFSQEDYLNDLEAIGGTDGSRTAVLDENGEVVYTDIWNFQTELKEKYHPIGANSLLEIVNNDSRWNGKLKDIYDNLETTLGTLESEVNAYKNYGSTWGEGNTNLSYIYIDETAKRVYSNKAEYEDYQHAKDSIANLVKDGKYVVVSQKLSDFQTNMEGDAESWRNLVDSHIDANGDFMFAVSVDTKYPIQDSFYILNQKYTKIAPLVGTILTVGISSLLLFLILLIWLTAIAGRTNHQEEVKTNLFDKMKTEFALALVGFGIFWAVYGIYGTGSFYQMGNIDTETAVGTYQDVFSTERMLLVGAMCVSAYAVFLIGYMSIVRRIKANTLWSNSIVKWLFERAKQLIDWMKEIYQNRSVTAKTIIIFCLVMFVHWIAATSFYNGFWLFIMLLVDALVFFYLVKNAVGKQRILIGIERIAKGEVDYKIPLYGLKGDQLIIAQRINSIGEGFEAAVEKSMKDERLKTDLITNVSHDIKTPLTSIINYVDLLKRENFQNPKIQGYLDILEAKAQRLKTLTEDVVEASKVSTGNITLEFMNINLVEMIQQTSGEFEEKFEKRNLKEVLTLPEESVLIRVDGRRMWRVLENIYNNAAKYAMEGTRIYADLKVKADVVSFSLKNVSEQPLNISSEELTERFIRGDVSRSTEGSGLGLSIAKSLTELQGGKFHLYLDGDLFKVTILFPLVKVQGEWEEASQANVDSEEE